MEPIGSYKCGLKVRRLLQSLLFEDSTQSLDEGLAAHVRYLTVNSKT